MQNNNNKLRDMKRVLITVLAIAVAFWSCNEDKEKIYTVTFNSNGGSEVVSQTIGGGEKAIEPQPEPIREGYYFGGWYTDNLALTNKWDFDTQNVTADIMLYAKWGTVKLLETLTYEHISYGSDKYDRYKFEYDEQNRIVKISEYFSGGELYNTTTFTYAGDDLVQVLYRYDSSDEIYDYTKNGNTIIQKYTYTGGTYISPFTTTSTIELNSDGLPITRKEERSGSTIVETYEYQDGNLTKNAITSTSQEYDYTDVYTYTYYYDNKKGALYHCKTPKWGLIMYLNDFGVENNITEGGHLFRPWSVYTYEYDGAEFPAKRTSKNYGQNANYSESIKEFIYLTK